MPLGHSALQPVAKVLETVAQRASRQTAHDLVLVTPLHPFSKLLAIQDNAQNLEEQL